MSPQFKPTFFPKEAGFFIFGHKPGAQEGGRNFSNDVMCQNLAGAYYLMVAGTCIAQLSHGKDFEKRWLPLATVRNFCRACALGIVRCACAEPFCKPTCFAEKICEHAFGEVRGYFRGNPSIADAIMGSQKRHLHNLRKPDLKEPEHEPRLEKLSCERVRCPSPLTLPANFLPASQWTRRLMG